MKSRLAWTCAALLAVASVHAPAQAAARKEAAPKPAAQKSAAAPGPAIVALGDTRITLADLAPPPAELRQFAGDDSARYEEMVQQHQSLQVTGQVIRSLLEQYAKQQHLEATRAEVSDVFASTLAALTAEDRKTLGALSDRTRAAAADTSNERTRQAVGWAVEHWKVNRALYDLYGGRVVFVQSTGLEPLDAQRKFLEAELAKGSFQIVDPAWKDRFWSYFTWDDIHQFVPDEVAREAMHTPWWRSPAPAPAAE